MDNSGSVADPEDRPKGWGLKEVRDAVDTSLDLGGGVKMSSEPSQLLFHIIDGRHERN